MEKWRDFGNKPTRINPLGYSTPSREMAVTYFAWHFGIIYRSALNREGAMRGPTLCVCQGKWCLKNSERALMYLEGPRFNWRRPDASFPNKAETRGEIRLSVGSPGCHLVLAKGKLDVPLRGATFNVPPGSWPRTFGLNLKGSQKHSGITLC